MIRYPIARAQLDAQIEAQSPGWLLRTEKRADGFRKRKRYAETSPVWSEVKPVYAYLQGQGKCAFCEREMESGDYAAYETDVEHFRPKGRIRAWPVPDELKGVPFTTPPNADKGYHLLPYHPLNYAAACKPCNSGLKKDFFPIAGAYNLDGDDPDALATEKPYLIYPIGTGDADPEALIDFHGTSPRAKAPDGHDRNRGLVTIAFFGLDDPGRKNLFRGRALIIVALYPLLAETQRGTAAERQAARDKIDGFLSPRLQHLNCAKSFDRLYRDRPVDAKAIYDRALELLISIS